MFWLLLIGVLVLVAGPIFWVLPTARQRQETNLRQRALASGVSVRLARLEHPNPAAEERVSAGGRTRTIWIPCARYALRVGQSRDAEGMQQWQLIRDCGGYNPEMEDERLPSGWLWRDKSRQPIHGAELEAVQGILGRLPLDVLALEVKDGEVGVFWLEKGELGQVDTIVAALADLRDLIKRPPVAC